MTLHTISRYILFL